MTQTKINLGGEDWFYGEELLKTLKLGVISRSLHNKNTAPL